jgi:ribosome-associated heat shock protein Hsp15
VTSSLVTSSLVTSSLVTNGCRIDVWLWRARFVKTRALAVEMVERGAIRLTHQGRQTRVDKPGRQVQPGDELTFVCASRVIWLRIEGLGERRGPAEEARRLYTELPEGRSPDSSV